MICEAKPKVYNVSDRHYHVCAAYLKGLHHGDKATDLMPQDKKYTLTARRFYDSLSADDKMVIDSFSNPELMEKFDIKQRNKRFQELTQMFACRIGTGRIQFVPPQDGERNITK